MIPIYQVPQINNSTVELSKIVPSDDSVFSFGGYEFGKNLNSKIKDRFKKPATTTNDNTNNNADTFTDEFGNNYKWNPMNMTYEINN